VGATRLVLIGAGSHSRSQHAPALARLAQERPGMVTLAAVCDLNRERAEATAQQFGFARACTDMHAMMAQAAPDGCVVVMPIERIVPVARELLRYRVPLLVEKPPGRTAAECAALHEAAVAAGVPVQVSVNRRFQPYLARALAWARAQGPLHLVSAFMLRSRRRERNFITDTAIHVIDALRHIGGEVTALRLRGGRGQEHGQVWFAATLEFASGLAGILLVHPDCGVVAERYLLHGESFTAEVQLGPLCPYELRCCRDNRDEVRESLPADAPALQASGVYEETCAFVEAIRAGRPPRPSLDEVAPSLALAEQIVREIG